jgi:biopolymer transport protein ExbD
LLLPAELAASGAVPSAVTPPESTPLAVEIWLKLTSDPQAGTIVDMNGTQYKDLAKVRTQLQSLASLGPENPVVLDVHADVPLKDVVSLYDTCQAAGFESVNFAVGKPAAEIPRP